MFSKKMLDIIGKKCKDIKGITEFVKLLDTGCDKKDNKEDNKEHNIKDNPIRSGHFDKISENIDKQQHDINFLKSLIDPDVEITVSPAYTIDKNNLLEKEPIIRILRNIVNFLDVKNSPLILTLKKMLDDENNKKKQLVYGLRRFIGYDIKDNFESVIFIVVSNSLSNLQYINLKQKSTILSGITNLIITSNQLKLNHYLKKKELNMIKTHLIKDFKIIQENINKKIQNGDKKDLYNTILREYYTNNIQLYQKYYKVILLFTTSLWIQLQLVLIPTNENIDYNLFDYICLYTYIFFVIVTEINYIQNKHNIISSSDYHTCRKRITNTITDIINNYNIINETNTYTKMSDKLIQNITLFIDEIYKINMGLTSVTNIERKRNTNKILWARYVFLIFTPYIPSMGYLLDYFWEILEEILDEFSNLEGLITNNLVYEDILRFVYEEKNSDSLFLHDAEILYNIQDLSHKFDDNVIFKNVDIIIPKNKWICFYGNSGCGKSTLCNILLKNLKHDSGKVIYLNEFTDYNYNNIRSSISFLNTDSDIFNETVLYNITFGLDNPDDISILEKINYYAEFFEFDPSKLKMNANSLSTGEKQRIKIIRLILHDKPIWILDEITSNINNDLEHKILQELRKIQKEKNKSVIHITHNFENIVFSDIKMYIKNKQIFSVLNTNLND